MSEYVCPNEHVIGQKDQDFRSPRARVFYIECGGTVFAEKSFDVTYSDPEVVDTWVKEQIRDHRIDWMNGEIDRLHKQVSALEDELRYEDS